MRVVPTSRLTRVTARGCRHVRELREVTRLHSSAWRNPDWIGSMGLRPPVLRHVPMSGAVVRRPKR